MALKYKVGDRVKVKSLDWYNKNKTSEGCLVCGSSHINPEMICMLGKIVTISSIEGNHYRIKEYPWNWTDEMIEGLVEEGNKPNTIEEAKTYWDSIKDAWICTDGYQFKDENGNVINAKKIVLEKKKKEYPKTYAECCKVLGIAVRDLDILDNMLDTTEIIYRKNLDRLLNSFRKLLICRDAYWKIAGEEMGLEEPWEPSDSDYITGRYCIFVHRGNIICDTPAQDCILTFPTEEMRDAFYENFKEEMEICKELL